MMSWLRLLVIAGLVFGRHDRGLLVKKDGTTEVFAKH